MDNKIKTNVNVRGKENPVSINITSQSKPEIGTDLLYQWQDKLDLLSKVMEVPTALISKVEEGVLEVFLSSYSNKNPYERGDRMPLGKGLYSETVLGENRMLEVQDATEDPLWTGNPDAEMKMISYLGFPLEWLDGEMFGTIGILDSKSRSYSETLKQVMGEFKNIVQKDLAFLEKTAEIEAMNENIIDISLRDSLTGLYNHKAIHEFLFIEIQNSIRYEKELTIAMVDIDRFKEVNDQFGHKMGDIVLSEFADMIKTRLRDADIIGRYGGDEFLIIFTDTSSEDAYAIIERLRKNAEKSEGAGIGITISAGIASLDGKCTAEEIVGRADEALYKAKNRGRNKVIDY